MPARQESCCFTGHRPAKLPWGYNESDPRCVKLKERIADAVLLAYQEGYRHFLCGMAQGCDLYFCEAVLALREPCVVELYSDSKYVIDALEKGWAWGWKRRGWVKADKKPALNPDLWDTLLGLTRQHEMHYHWVKGHEANEKNNRCDEQAVLESRKFKR